MVGGAGGDGAEDSEGACHVSVAVVVCGGEAAKAALETGAMMTRGHCGLGQQVGLVGTQPYVRVLFKPTGCREKQRWN